MDGRDAGVDDASSNWSWFQAQMPPVARGDAFGPAITRFAPGRIGPGLTDDLEDGGQPGMPAGAVFYQHYGLWYDRRRVNHNYDGSAERRTGDVWAPFVELPWARSGTGQGVGRAQQVRPDAVQPVVLRPREGVRRPRRPARARPLLQLLLPALAGREPFALRRLPVAAGQRHPGHGPAGRGAGGQRLLRRRRTRCGATCTGATSATCSTRSAATPTSSSASTASTPGRSSSCTSGWTRSRSGRRNGGTTVRIALEIPKDQLDAILADPVRAPLITAIDVHDWLYRADGSLFAARGGLNRAPREQRPDIATPGRTRRR